MAEEYLSFKGISITFASSKDGKQLVHWQLGDLRVVMTISEYLDFIIPATSEANRRRTLELRREQHERRFRS